MIEFKEFPKIARFQRDIIITEKIDGTNASVLLQNEALEEPGYLNDPSILAIYEGLTLRAGSRTKWLSLGKQNDNYGFAQWALNNIRELVKLGEGHHFGEWWGLGINRGYGLKEKRFSLFNTYRWADINIRPACCSIVPFLYQGVFDTRNIDCMLDHLKAHGSAAAPGFMRPEGIVVFHTAGNVMFKKTIEKDDSPKSLIS